MRSRSCGSRSAGSSSRMVCKSCSEPSAAWALPATPRCSIGSASRPAYFGARWLAARNCSAAPSWCWDCYALCGGGRRHLHDRGREIHLGEGLFLDAGRLGIRAADRLLRAVLSHPRRRRLVARPRDRTRTLIERKRVGASAIHCRVLVTSLSRTIGTESSARP